MSIAGKWGFSHSEESYTGHYDTKEEAIREGMRGMRGGEIFWVGQYREPAAPESFVDGVTLLENVTEQDEYCGEEAYGCFDCTKEQEQELTDMIARVFGEWLDKHDLRPMFGIVEYYEKVTVPDTFLEI